ncbi:MAG: hypothetical protein RLZ98_386 [Pseudomonadota bacterium]|jgi:hypothetical protein
MVDSTTIEAEERPLAAYLPAVLLAGGALNGFAVRMLEAWQQTGAATLFLGVSPFEVIALLVGLHLIVGAASEAPALRVWPEAMFAMALLLPSSTLSWVATGVYAAYLAGTSRGAFRNGACLLALLAATAIWSSAAMKWIALPITIFEAHAVWSMLALLRPDISVTGNVVGIPGGHQVIILAACSTAYILPKALLALYAVAAFVDSVDWARLAWWALGLAILITAGNWLRLAAMSWSAPMFELAHGPVGANIFDLFQTALVVAPGLLLCKR